MSRILEGALSTTIAALLVTGCAVSLLAPPLRAQNVQSAQGAQDPAAQPGRCDSPFLQVLSRDPLTDRIPLKSTRADVQIAGVIAEVTVTQVYRNEGNKALEAIYVFPGSTRAAVHAMRMRIGDRVLDAVIREKEQARREYEQARQEGRSASLLEQHRPNVFQMNVANILPGDEVKVELHYTELLVPSEGRYQFVFPTVVGPRYTGEGGGGAWSANGHTAPGVAPAADFDLHLDLQAGMPISDIRCGTHRTRIARATPTVASLDLDTAERAGANRDLVVDYQLSGQAIQSGLILSKGRDENFFLLMLQPPAQVQAAAIPPREYVFILDVSGSMKGYPLDISKKIAQDLVSNLGPQDRFNVMAFEGGSEVWASEGSRPATSANLKAALAFVDSRTGSGGTNMLSAIQKALALPASPGMSRSFVILTDGYVSADERVLDFLRTHLDQANMHAFGIGTSVNRHLIESMARAGQGESFVALRPEEAKELAKRFRRYIASPVLTQVRLAFPGFQVQDLEPAQQPDLLAERPILCIGKWSGEPLGRVEASGATGHGSFQSAIELSEATTGGEAIHAALRSLWARKRIQSLEDSQTLRQDPARKEAITALGLRYNLLTSYTSFVAVDTLVRNPGEPIVTVRQPLPMPQGVPVTAVAASNTSACMTSVSSSTPSFDPSRIRGGTGHSAGAVVEVVACAASADMAQVEDPRAPRAGRTRSHLHLRVRAGRPGLDLSAIRAQLLAHIREFRAKGLVEASLRTRLSLQVDASGVVRAVRLLDGAPCPELEKALAGLRLRAWKGEGTALALTLQ